MTASARTSDNPMGPWSVAKDFRVPEGFTDISWEQDVTPSVQCDATGLVIQWDDEENSNFKRELGWLEGEKDGQWCRFYVFDPDSGADTPNVYEGNDLEAAIAAARAKKEQ